MTQEQKKNAAEVLFRSIRLVGGDMHLSKIFVVNGQCYWFLNAAKRAAVGTDYPIEVLTFEEAYRIHTGKANAIVPRNAIAWEFNQTGECFDGGKLFCDNYQLTASMVKNEILSSSKKPMTVAEISEDKERIFLIDALKHNQYNKRRTATYIGLSLYLLNRKIDNFNITIPTQK